MNNLIPILFFCFSTTFTPGPNNLMIMSSGLNFGIKKSIPHYLGICLGFPAMVLIVALGFGALFMKYHWIHNTLKILGIAYILYLAWKIARSKSDINNKKPTKPLTFIQAVLFQWVNPKAWTMVIGAISIFTIPGNYFVNQSIEITLIFLLVCLPCIGAWLIFGTVLQRFLKNEKHQVMFNYGMAICLVLSIALIFIE